MCIRDSAPVPDHDRRALDGFQKLAVATTITSLVLIALGGLVRGTNNGLACPDWPRCYGRWFPRQADLPEGLTLVNVWIEHSHRGAAAILGAMVLVLAVWALWKYRRPSIVLPAVGILVAVGIQAWIGRQVVLGLLAAETVTAHLALGTAILGFLIYLMVTVSLPRARGAAARGRDLRLARDGQAAARRRACDGHRRRAGLHRLPAVRRRDLPRHRHGAGSLPRRPPPPGVCACGRRAAPGHAHPRRGARWRAAPLRVAGAAAETGRAAGAGADLAGRRQPRQRHLALDGGSTPGRGQLDLGGAGARHHPGLPPIERPPAHGGAGP